jgi:peptidoglycan glycosyltransferase
VTATSYIAQRRRSTELGLIVMAVVITGSAYTLSALGRDADVPANLFPFLAIILGLLIVAHLATRKFAAGADGTLLPLAAFLNGIGYVMLARLDADRFAGPQATWTLIGIGAYIATLMVLRRVNDLRRYQWTFFVIGVVLLLLPLVPGIGVSVGGARIWISVGPIGFQPGEIAKICLAIFFAGYLTERRELIAAGTWRVGPFNLPEPKYLFPIVMAWAFTVIVMVGEKDLGSSLMFFTLFVVLLWVATEKASFLVIGTAMFAAAAFVAWELIANVQNRVNLWLDPWSRYDQPRGGYQVIQGLFAMGSGGIGGAGLGLGTPTKIPAAHNDFIFAAIAEELGLFGATAVLMAFVLFVGAGLRTAMRSERTFEKLLATGLTTIFGVQAFIIIGGVVRVLPLTGVTLPFVSYGGSSLVANYILLAILMRISDSSARRLGELPEEVSFAERRAAKRFAKASRQAERDSTVVAHARSAGST